MLATKLALRCIILIQYIPRFIRIYPLSSELKRTAGVFAETAWAGAAYYLLLYMLASHVSTNFISLSFLRNNMFIKTLFLTDCWGFVVLTGFRT